MASLREGRVDALRSRMAGIYPRLAHTESSRPRLSVADQMRAIDEGSAQFGCSAESLKGRQALSRLAGRVLLFPPWVKIKTPGAVKLRARPRGPTGPRRPFGALGQRGPLGPAPLRCGPL